MKIKNVVFDVGDVLIHFRYKEYMRDLGFNEYLVEHFTNNVVFSDCWNQMDMGNVTIEGAKQVFSEKFPEYKKEVELFCKDLTPIVEEYDYAKGLIKSIKETGVNVYILSNYPRDLSEMHWPKFKFLSETDGKIISGFEHIMKPDPRIYKLLESRFGIKLEESVFVDDREGNVKGAEAVGMKGIVFTGVDNLKNELRKLGIDVK